ncbi:glycoside hydrolase family 2 protein [Paenibacillus sp. 2TAB23]|uniref:glycoside hydrolase family 2 protein n=1 Tax=Paenibacillus sp. 2TAB23 TaxID=3233004 RepID=UPI003F9CDBA8
MNGLQIIDLNENWMFTPTDRSAYAIDPIYEGKPVALPHSWNHSDGQGEQEQYFRGQCWYQHNLQISSELLAKRLFLEIGAAGNRATVYVNGQLAGESRCGYAMFRVRLNRYLKAGENLISVAVDNRHAPDVFPLMADFTFYGGLYREVKLLAMEDVYFDVEDLSRDGVYLTPKKIDNDSFELEIRGTLVNESPKKINGVLKAQLLSQDGNIAFEFSRKLEVEAATEFNIVETETVRNPFLWDGVDHPYLYNACISFTLDGRVYDLRHIEIGFRTVEVTPDRGVLLNGKPLKLKGVSRHQDYAGVGNAVTKEQMEEDMAIIRDMGANSIRLAHYQHDDYFYKLCDRSGMLVWAEIPFISTPSSQDPENRNAKEQLERLIKQAYNHCSIYCWGVQNEITIAVENEQTYETIRQLHAMAKQLDPNRLSAQANIYSVENDNLIHDLTDMVGYNLYYGWYYGELNGLGSRLDEFHRVNPQVPVLVSEYGVDANPRFQSDSPKVKDYSEQYQIVFHHNAIKTIQDRSFIMGGYVWNMFDFGSASRNEGGDRGKNMKGLVTLDRKLKKDAYYLYKAYWSKEPFVHLAGRRFVNRHEANNDLLIMSNLSRLKVYNNDVWLDEIKTVEPVNRLRAVTLALGENRIRVEGIDENGNIYTDEMTLHYVTEIDKSYTLVAPEQNNHVVNWFEKFDLSNVQEVNLRDGFYSTFDTVEELCLNEEAKAVFEKYFGNMADNPQFAAMKAVMSIEKLSKISMLKIPKELLSVINKELNIIKK